MENFELTTEDINDLVSTALEGGINYWCGRAEKKRNLDNTLFGISTENQNNVKFASDIIGFGGTLILYDNTTSDKWELNREKLLKGFELQCTNKGVTPLELMDDYDADDADSIIQYAIMGEIVFS